MLLYDLSCALASAKPSLASVHCVFMLFFLLLLLYFHRTHFSFANITSASPMGQGSKQFSHGFKIHYCITDRPLEGVLNCK